MVRTWGHRCVRFFLPRRGYSPHGAYAQSKLALVLFTYHLQHLLDAQGSHVTANAVDPGVVNTDLYQHVFWGTRLVKKMTGWLLFKVSLWHLTCGWDLCQPWLRLCPVRWLWLHPSHCAMVAWLPLSLA
jgi:hypothetical protein